MTALVVMTADRHRFHIRKDGTGATRCGRRVTEEVPPGSVPIVFALCCRGCVSGRDFSPLKIAGYRIEFDTPKESTP